VKTLTLFAVGFGLAFANQTIAQDKPELTVYTYDSFVTEWGPGPKVKQAFEAECDCTLNLVAAGDGAALLARLQLEGKQSDADIALGLDTNLIARAKATGLFAEHKAENQAFDIPVTWDDTVFLPYDWGYFSFVYDNTKLENVPDSFEALAAMPESFKIVIQDPRSSTPGLGLLLWVKAAYGARAPAIWADLAPHILTVTKGWSEAYGMFLEGEADMVLSYTTSPAYHIYADKDATKSAAPFKEGHYMQIEVAGKLAATDQPELADQFLTFMASDKFQSVIPTTNWMYPAVKLKDGLPKAFDHLITPENSLLLDAATIETTKKETLQEWLTALSQ
jgi:thiamine transport system substrate-binding protein